MFSCHQNDAEEKHPKTQFHFALKLSYLYLSNTSRVAQAL